MFGVLLAHPQEALHGRSIGGYCVLKLIISSCRTVCVQYVLVDYIGLGISESENAVGSCRQWRTQEFFRRGFQKIQLRIEGREKRDLGR
jgi:hypothetical protein